MPKEYGQKDDHESYAELNELRDKVATLEEIVRRVANANAMENVIVNGFSELSAKLEPLRELRDLTPRREGLPSEKAALLREIQESLHRPRWKGSLFEADRTPEDPHCSRSVSS
jgi:hypothetical protein